MKYFLIFIYCLLISNIFAYKLKDLVKDAAEYHLDEKLAKKTGIKADIIDLDDLDLDDDKEKHPPELQKKINELKDQFKSERKIIKEEFKLEKKEIIDNYYKENNLKKKKKKKHPQELKLLLEQHKNDFKELKNEFRQIYKESKKNIIDDFYGKTKKSKPSEFQKKLKKYKKLKKDKKDLKKVKKLF